MTTLPPSPFLTESPESVEDTSRVSTVAEAAAHSPPLLGAAADPYFMPASVVVPDGCGASVIPAFSDVPEIDTGDIPEIFRCANLLCADARRQAEIDRHGLAAVAHEIDAWMAESDPLPLFLR